MAQREYIRCHAGVANADYRRQEAFLRDARGWAILWQAWKAGQSGGRVPSRWSLDFDDFQPQLADHLGHRKKGAEGVGPLEI